MTTQLTQTEIKELLSKITQGEWEADEFAVYGANREPAAHTGGCERSNEKRIANAQFIAAAPSIVRNLLAQLEAAEQWKERTIKRCEEVDNVLDTGAAEQTRLRTELQAAQREREEWKTRAKEYLAQIQARIPR